VEDVHARARNPGIIDAAGRENARCGRRRMNIVHILRAPVGGLFRHVLDLAAGQIERGHRVGIIADSDTSYPASEATLAALKPKLALGLARIRMRRQPHPADAIALLQIARYIRGASAQVVHGHGAKGGALARLVPVRKGILRVYTPHGGSLHDAVGNRLHIMMEKALMRHGNLYLFESAYSRDAYFQKVGRPRNSYIVHNGVSPEEFEPITLNADASDLVYLGELRALKGVDLLIDAIASLRGQGRLVAATIVGDGPDAAALRARVTQLQLGDVVHFRGPMPARSAFALGRAVVVPSRAESLPYVVLEAAAATKPLVATKVGGIPEIFGPLAKHLVPGDNTDALAQAIAEVLDHPAEAERRALVLRSRIAEAFSIDAMVEQVLVSYQKAFAAENVAGLPRYRALAES
jgi:glycosyltransferase involved in cell wall biosynthesis